MNVSILILLLMFICHIIDDFKLQGILSELKQKVFWKKYLDENYEYTNDYKIFEKLYRNDYKISLLIHSFDWSFSILLFPMLYFTFMDTKDLTILFCILIVLNTVIHYIIDDLKANKLMISLVKDQVMHFIQIIISWIILFIIIQ